MGEGRLFLIYLTRFTEWLLAGLLCIGLPLCTDGHWGRYVSYPVDTPEKADLIVSLGGETGFRKTKALELYQQGYAPRILLTGINRSGDDRVDYLINNGVPKEAILLDSQSANTWEESKSTFLLLLARGWNKVLVVSDAPHLRRLAWTWGKVFAGSRLSYRLIAAPLPGWDADRWRDGPAQDYVLLEVFKLGWYILRY